MSMHSIPETNLTIVGLRDDPWLKGLFVAWSNYLGRFERELEYRDVPWIYREETHAGLLAAAASEQGAFALVESRTETVNDGKAFLDLWISGPIGVRTATAEIELKRWHKNYYRYETLWNQVGELLNQAVIDVDLLARHDDEARRYALVAVPLMLSERRWRSRSRRSYEREAKSSVLTIGAMGAGFTVVHSTSKTIRTTGGGHRTFGIAFVGKRCK